MGDEREADDAALRWEGDDDLGRMTSLDAPVIGGRGAERQAGGGPEAAASPAAPAEAEAPAAPRDVPLAIATALAGLAAIAETVGWILVLQGVQRAGLATTGSGALDFLGGIARFFALVSSPLWFVTVLHLTRAARPRRRLVRIGWLALGIGLLVPWPLLLGLVA